MRKPEKIFIPRQLSIGRCKGLEFCPIQSFGNEAFLKKFPQATTGLSKTNLERWFSCVNLPQRLSASELSKFRTSAENEGHSALPDLQEENGDR
jgi:hypothetical protein